MTKLIRFPLDVGRQIAETADREHRTFTGQVLHWVLKGMEADGITREEPDHGGRS